MKKNDKARLNILVAARLAAALVAQAGGSYTDQRRAYRAAYGLHYARFKYATSPKWRAAIKAAGARWRRSIAS